MEFTAAEKLDLCDLCDSANIENCLSCNRDFPELCVSCEANFYLANNGTECTACESDFLLDSGCARCSETSCLECLPGYYEVEIAATGEFKCEKCDLTVFNAPYTLVPNRCS